MNEYDVLILGAGAAGYSAAIYASRYNLTSAVIGKEPGGVASEAAEIENYPGFKKITGFELMEKFREQAESLGAKVKIYADIVSVEKEGDVFVVKLSDDEVFRGKTLVTGLGSKRRKLGIPGEAEFAGKGVSYCATCDGAFFKDKKVAIIGGNDSAAKAALILSDVAENVKIIYRRDAIRAEPVLVDRIKARDNIEFVYNAIPVKINGDAFVKSIEIEQKGEKKEIELDGVFVEIGSIPEENITGMIGLEKDERGYIVVSEDMSTNVEGVYAAGDITTGSNMFRQMVTAISEGAIAAESIYKYLKERKPDN